MEEGCLRRRFVDLREDLRVLEHVVFLSIARQYSKRVYKSACHLVTRTRKRARPRIGSVELEFTSSPTLMLLPPQPGNKTLSPAFTLTGTTSPVLGEGAPGPTAMTVASGMVDEVEEEGMKRPEAVFYRRDDVKAEEVSS